MRLPCDSLVRCDSRSGHPPQAPCGCGPMQKHWPDDQRCHCRSWAAHSSLRPRLSSFREAPVLDELASTLKDIYRAAWLAILQLNSPQPCANRPEGYKLGSNPELSVCL